MTITEVEPAGAAAPRRVVRLDGALVAIPLELIETAVNHRGHIDPAALKELADSMAELGQLLPVVVETVGVERYRILEGHRRLKAAPHAGLDRLIAVVRRPVDGARAITQLAIHAQVRPFEPIAEAKALAHAIFSEGRTREQVAAAVGKTPAWVAQRLALLNLTPEEQHAVETRQMPLALAHQRAREVRAARDGRTCTPTPAVRRTPPVERHLVTTHPLAAAAAARCFEHRDRVRIGGVACGECWENSIRADLTAGGSQ